MGHYEIKPPAYEKFIEKTKCIPTNDKLENGLIYSYKAFPFNVINVSTTYIVFKSWIKDAFIICKIHVHFLMRKSLSITSSIGYISMIALNKQRQEHNDLVTIQREKLKGAHEHSKSL